MAIVVYCRTSHQLSGGSLAGLWLSTRATPDSVRGLIQQYKCDQQKVWSNQEALSSGSTGSEVVDG